MTPDLARICRAFPCGAFREARPWGSGHIHDTYLARLDGGDYVLQRINRRVFRDPLAVMENIDRVCRHLASKLSDPRRRLEVVRTREGELCYRDSEGDYWRMFPRIPGVVGLDRVVTEQQAYQVGRAFGEFLRHLADLPGPRLHETIPGFHDTLRRVQDLEAAISADRAGRVADCREEIAFARERQSTAGRLLELSLPERITHNDTKANNVLLDAETGEALCVVDLDTVMPGRSLFDFGDMVRSAANTAEEDEPDLSRVGFSLPLFRSLARGYLEGAELSEAEIREMPFSARLIAYETGVRFLTDHLEGDRYFKVHRPGHNLDRARVQFRLVEAMEQQADRMEEAVAAARA